MPEQTYTGEFKFHGAIMERMGDGLVKRCMAAGAEKFETYDGQVVFGIKTNGSEFPEISVQPIGHKETAVTVFLRRCRKYRDAMNIILEGEKEPKS